MFEDSLVESAGRIRTRSSKLAVGSLLLQTVILSVLVLLPYLHPAALPRQAMAMVLNAPLPPPRLPRLPESAIARSVPAASPASLHLPSRIPPHAAVDVTDALAPSIIGAALANTASTPIGALQELFSNGTRPSPRVVADAIPRPGPLRISSGVAAGQLLTPILPVYPVIAKTARIEGTVIVEATISRTGMIENAHAITGPPLLIPAAITAIAQARYRPYQLNSRPVEVETTIRVVFSLDRK